jgi:carbonic anhydrase
MRTHTKETQATTTPQMALQLLRVGNYRFQNNLKVPRDLLQQVNETRDGQFPFATILSYIDSRTGAELIFDHELGDIFSIQLAGNVVGDAVLGSMEFVCKLIKRRDKKFCGIRRCVFPHRSTYHESREQQFEGNLSSTLPSSVRE